MSKLYKSLVKKVSNGLSHKATTKCSEYACKYRVMGPPYPGKWTFRYHPWLKDMHDCDAETMVGEKSAQGGFTEVGLNKSFFAIDMKCLSVLYVLPNTRPAATNFSASRFDPALELSPHLRSIFSDTRNVNHKRAGTASLFIRGSRSKADMKSDPAGLMIFDEVEEMVQENIVLAFERMSGQTQKQKYLLSTPTIEDYGIDVYYKNTTQQHYFFTCPHCGKLTELVYPECLVICGDDPNGKDVLESHLICKECKQRLEQDQKQYFLQNGVWVPSVTDKIDVGFHINQLYSSTVAPHEIAREVLKAETNPAVEQELYNSKLGRTHTVKGAQISDNDLVACYGDFKMQETAEQTHVITMGVDVGKWLHYEINKWRIPEGTTYYDLHQRSIPYVIKAGRVESFEELAALLLKFKVHCCVIDANPERRKVRELISRFSNVFMCFYGNNAKGVTIYKTAEEESAITVDRTSWLDTSLTRFTTKRIKIAYDIPREYKDHLKVPVRVYKLDVDENPVATYLSRGLPDHHAHARNYAEIALSKFYEIGQNEDI